MRDETEIRIELKKLKIEELRQEKIKLEDDTKISDWDRGYIKGQIKGMEFALGEIE